MYDDEEELDMFFGNLYGSSISADVDLPSGRSLLDEWLDEALEEKVETASPIKCECGAEASFGPNTALHVDWCPKFGTKELSDEEK